MDSLRNLKGPKKKGFGGGGGGGLLVAAAAKIGTERKK